MTKEVHIPRSLVQPPGRSLFVPMKRFTLKLLALGLAAAPLGHAAWEDAPACLFAPSVGSCVPNCKERADGSVHLRVSGFPW